MMQRIVWISVQIVPGDVTEQNLRWTCGSSGKDLLVYRYHTHTYMGQQSAREIRIGARMKGESHEHDKRTSQEITETGESVETQ